MSNSQKIDLESFLQQHNIPIAPPNHHHVTQGWIGVDCPYCAKSSKFRMGFLPSDRRCNCWVCGNQNPIKALAEVCKISEKESAGFWGNVDYIPSRKSEHTGKLKLPRNIKYDLLPAHEDYLQERGFDPNTISKLWGIGCIGPALNLQWRIFIPVHDIYGTVVSWTTRSISDAVKIRYMSAPPDSEWLPLKSVLYGAHLARHIIFLVEGPLDAWAIGPGAVATCGVGFSPEQMAEMTKYPCRVICYDSEPQAQRKATQLCNHLSAFPGETHNVILESGKDSAEADQEEIMEMRNLFGLE